MKTTLEISLKYARRGIESIQDSFHILKEANDSIEITSSNTIEYEVDKDDDENAEVDIILDGILIQAGIPKDEYWFNEENPLYLFR